MQTGGEVFVGVRRQERKADRQKQKALVLRDRSRGPMWGRSSKTNLTERKRTIKYPCRSDGRKGAKGKAGPKN